MLREILKEKNMTMYQCAKLSGIPYTTISEVVRGKTQIAKCSAETVYRLSKALSISMEDLMRDSVEVRPDFEVFKSNVCHRVKDTGELDFIIKTLNDDDIRKYWKRKWYPEAFYMLAMVDYLSRLNDIPLCTRYDEIRACSLKQTMYPRDVLLASKFNIEMKEQCKKEAIPEFLRFNIVESEVRNVY